MESIEATSIGDEEWLAVRVGFYMVFLYCTRWKQRKTLENTENGTQICSFPPDRDIQLEKIQFHRTFTTFRQLSTNTATPSCENLKRNRHTDTRTVICDGMPWLDWNPIFRLCIWFATRSITIRELIDVKWSKMLSVLRNSRVSQCLIKSLSSGVRSNGLIVQVPGAIRRKHTYSAAILEEFNKPLKIETITNRTILSDGMVSTWHFASFWNEIHWIFLGSKVRVGVHYCSLNATDVKYMSGGHEDILLPMIPGSEFSGEVLEVGDRNRHNFRVGENVSALLGKSLTLRCGSQIWMSFLRQLSSI